MATINSQISRRFFKISRVVRSPLGINTKDIQTNKEQISDILEGTREMFDSIQKVIHDGNIEKAKGKGPKKSSANLTSIRPKIGRNDPCWCGSGKKFKKCHGR
jgi:uncharacterized protein YecA (UPF0149 family)